MEYRLATHGDVEQIALLHAESWRQTFRGMFSDEFLDRDVVRDRLAVWGDRLSKERKEQFVLVALNDSRLDGFICVYGDEDRRWGSLVDNLHVAPEQKRSGIGTSLMCQAACWLREHHPRSGVYLWVLEANEPARRFYEKLGANDAGTFDKENADGGSARSCLYTWPSPGALARASCPDA
jgi:ribosomal protein S18 acetylase RimI-like enzyme